MFCDQYIMLVAFVFICIVVAAVVGVTYAIFFDWYEKKRNRETERWQEERLAHSSPFSTK